MSTVSPPRRRALNTRACDRCRRRKAKCDSIDTSSVCSSCLDVGNRCTFTLPTGKRGPKSRRSQLGPLSATSLQPPSTWETGHTAGSALSPQQAAVSPTISTLLDVDSSSQRWVDLAAAVHGHIPTQTLEAIVRKSLDVFFEYLFPLIPVVHEPTVREALDFFVSRNTGPDHPTSPRSNSLSPSWTSSFASDAIDGASSTRPARSKLWPESTFTLITAICAEAAFMLPKELFPEGNLVADVFLQASRSCLLSYLEADLEHPDSNSVAIRYFHSNCLHAAGKPKYSWHIFGEAVRFAQVMQLHDESSHDGLFPIEAELRRRTFWIVYLGDKSAAILNNRPITIHKFSFESGITCAYPSVAGACDEPVVSPPNRADTPIRPNFIVGFNTNLQLWRTATDLLLELRLIQDRRHDTPLSPLRLTDEERAYVESLYVRFATCLDGLPPYLQPEALLSWNEQDGQSRQFMIQIANIQVTYYCLRMMITQKLEEVGYYMAGIESTDMLVLTKTDIARDMLRIARQAPFWSLQVNGEPCVEKIRLIGASLLEIMHRNETSPLSLRARSDFTVLLDILTRLDSKASDTLRSGSSGIL